MSSLATSSHPAADLSPNRSDLTIVAPVNPKLDNKPRTRIKITRVARSLPRYLGVFNRLTEGVSRYAVGPGLMAKPETNDPTDNDRFAAYFHNWAKSRLACDRSGKNNFYEKQEQTVTHLLRDGESIEVQQRSRFGTPQLLKVDSLFVGGAGSPHFEANRKIVDGVRVDDFNKALGFYVQVKGDRKFQYVTANNVLHVAKFKEADQQRGISWLAGGMNNGRDIIDLTSLEKQAAKIHSALAVLVKRKGESGPDLKRTLGANKSTEESIVDIEGAMMIDTKGDIEDFDLKTSNRPNLDIFKMINALVRDIAWNVGLPFEWVWDICGAGGANTRFVMADVNVFISNLQRLLISRFCQPTYQWVLASGFKQYRETGGQLGLAPGNDPEWWKCGWSTPEKVTVDIGRDGKLLLELRNQGLLTDERYYAALGQDSKTEKLQSIREIADDMALCEEMHVPYEYFRQSLLSKTQGLQGQQNETP